MLALISNGFLEFHGLLSLCSIVFCLIVIGCYAWWGQFGSFPCLILLIVIWCHSGSYVANNNGTAFASIEEVKEMPVLEQMKWDLDGKQYARINVPTEYGGWGFPFWVYNPASANIILLAGSLYAIWLIICIGVIWVA